MSALAKKMTLDDFVARKEQKELRYEFDGVPARASLGGRKVEYQTIAPLRRYVPHQAQAAAQVLYRGEDGGWTYDFVSEPGVLEILEVDITIALAEIYDGVF